MGGGPSSEQKAAASSQANLTNQLAGVAGREQQFKETQQNKVNPFYSDLMAQGPDYTNAALDSESGVNAQAYAPARAALMRRLGMSTGLPSGSREQSITDFEANRARGFDQGLMGILADRQAGRERGASGLLGQAQIANPLGYYSGALQGNQSIMQAPLQRPGMAGVLGGLLGGGLSAFA